MAESKFNVEGATNGLVLALFLASAIFLGVMMLYVLSDIRKRTSASGPSAETGAAPAAVQRAVPARADLPAVCPLHCPPAS